MASPDTPTTAVNALGALPNGEKKGAEGKQDGSAEKREQENGHVRNVAAASGSPDLSKRSQSPSGSSAVRRRRSASSQSVSSATTGRIRRRKLPSMSPSGSPRRRRGRSDSPPLRRRRSGSRRRSISR